MPLNQSSYLSTPDFVRSSLHVMTCLEVPVHVFGTYCILFRTPASMNSVKWTMFNLHFWSAALDLTISLLVAPFLLLPTLSGFSLGLFHEFGFSLEFELYFTLVMFAMVGIAIFMIFENRFTVLFVENHWWSYARKPYLALNFLLALTYATPTILMIPEQEPARKDIAERLLRLPDDLKSVPFLVVGANLHNIMSIVLEEYLIVFQPPIFIALLFWNMRNRATRWNLSEHSLKLQRAFLSAVIIQIFVPLLLLAPPLLYIAYSMTFSVYNQVINNLLFIVFSTHGLSSTAIMLLIHRPYREVCKTTFRWILFKKASKLNDCAHLGTTILSFSS